MSAVLEQSANEAAFVEPQDESLQIAVAVTPAIRQAASSTGALAVAQAWEIDSVDMAQALADERRSWAKRIDQIEAMKKDLFSPVKKAVEDMRAKLSTWFDAPLADLNAARDLAQTKLLAWQKSEEERVARAKAAAEAEARRIRQEAEKKAAEERAKAAELERQKNERARQEAEAKAKAEAEARAAAERARLAREAGDKEAARIAAEEQRKAETEARSRAAAEAKATAEAEAAASNGAAKANELEAQGAAASSAVAPVVEVAKIAGQALKANWVAVLEDGVTEDQAKLKIVQAIAAGRSDLMPLLVLDTAPRGPLNKLAAALKEAMTVPGFKAKNIPSLAGSRKG